MKSKKFKLESIIALKKYTKNIGNDQDDSRKKMGIYQTPLKLSKKLVKILGIKDKDRILEPSAGCGSFVLALKSLNKDVLITCVEPIIEQTDVIANFKNQLSCKIFTSTLEETYKHFKKFDIIIGNPPYNLAEEHIKILYELLNKKGKLGLLLRLNFLGSQKRIKFWKKYVPKYIYVLSERPSFYGGTDQTEYAFFIWQKNWTKRYSYTKVIQWR